MKHSYFFFYLIVGIVAILLTSCQAEELVMPTPPVDTCYLGHIEIHDTNVHFVRNPNFNTIICHYPSAYGIATVTWVDGQIDWSCLGFTRQCEAYDITVEAGNQSCTFTIPGGVNCNL